MARLASILAGLAAVAATAVQAQDAQVELPTGQVRLRDIAAGIAEADPLGERIVARIAPEQGTLILDRGRVENILRLAAPDRALAPKWESRVVLSVRATPSAPLPGMGCSALSGPVSGGELLTADLLLAVACREDEAPPRGIVFDREARSLRAVEDLPGDTYLGRISLPASSALPAGSALTLRTTSGPVVIERAVRTIQTARPGDRVFVQASDGTLLVGQLAEAAQ